jgi:3-oxoisoapionate decarboxylase
MRRRDALKSFAALSFAAAAVADEGRAQQPLGLVIHSNAVRASRPMPPEFPPINEPLAFVEHAATLGAAGIQTRIGLSDKKGVDALRAATERHRMYLEGIVALPKDETDLPQFETEVASAKAAGASVLRTVCLSGRRYETFHSRDEFDEFARRSWKSLTLAEPICAQHHVRLAVENHKDWRMDEMLGWLKRLSSEYVGVCLDTGNSMALLEEPHAVVEAYAPWTMTTHLKDMAAQEYDDGFLLSEVPFGEGLLDLPKVVGTIRQNRPGARLNLEMITRDPLRVPCLTPSYWATMPQLPARELADALARVRQQRFDGPLPTISNLSRREQLVTEAENIRKCLEYAKKKLV